MCQLLLHTLLCGMTPLHSLRILDGHFSVGSQDSSLNASLHQRILCIQIFPSSWSQRFPVKASRFTARWQSTFSKWLLLLSLLYYFQRFPYLCATALLTMISIHTKVLQQLVNCCKRRSTPCRNWISVRTFYFSSSQICASLFVCSKTGCISFCDMWNIRNWIGFQTA